MIFQFQKVWTSLAVVELVNSQDVDGGQFLSLSNIHCFIRNRSDGIQTIGRESCFCVVHDGGVVIRRVEVVGVLQVKVRLHWWLDVCPVDLDITVTVTPSMLMIETERMVQLVLDDAIVNTTEPAERDHLSTACFAHTRVASGGQETRLRTSLKPTCGH